MRSTVAAFDRELDRRLAIANRVGLNFWISTTPQSDLDRHLLTFEWKCVMLPAGQMPDFNVEGGWTCFETGTATISPHS